MRLSKSLRLQWMTFTLLYCLFQVSLLNWYHNESTDESLTTTHGTGIQRILLDLLAKRYPLRANQIGNMLNDPFGCRNCNRTHLALRKQEAHSIWEKLEQLDKELEQQQFDKDKAQCPLLSLEIRKPTSIITANTPRVAICAIARNETLYLDEWMTYHRAVAGFSEIFLFDNSRPDGMELYNSRRYSHCEGITIIPWPHAEAPQLDAYDVCVHMIREQNNEQQQPSKTNNKKKVSHIAFIDIDEFIVLKNEKETVVDVLQELVPPQQPSLLRRRSTPVSLSINWITFGTSNHTKYIDEPVTKRFQYRTPKSQEEVKSIVLVDAIRDAMHPHFAFLKQYPWRKFHTVISNGTIVQNDWPHVPGGGATDRIVVHHYALKSLAEFHLKGCVRGRADLPTTHESHKSRCKNKKYDIFVGKVFDDSAWKALTKWVPAYGTMYKD